MHPDQRVIKKIARRPLKHGGSSGENNLQLKIPVTSGIDWSSCKLKQGFEGTQLGVSSSSASSAPENPDHPLPRAPKGMVPWETGPVSAPDTSIDWTAALKEHQYGSVHSSSSSTEASKNSPGIKSTHLGLTPHSIPHVLVPPMPCTSSSSHSYLSPHTDNLITMITVANCTATDYNGVEGGGDVDGGGGMEIEDEVEDAMEAEIQFPAASASIKWTMEHKEHYHVDGDALHVPPNKPQPDRAGEAKMCNF